MSQGVWWPREPCESTGKKYGGEKTLKVTPRKTNMVHLKMGAPWKRRFLLKTIIFRFHVSFRGGTLDQVVPLKCVFFYFFLQTTPKYASPFRTGLINHLQVGKHPTPLTARHVVVLVVFVVTPQSFSCRSATQSCYVNPIEPVVHHDVVSPSRSTTAKITFFFRVGCEFYEFWFKVWGEKTCWKSQLNMLRPPKYGAKNMLMLERTIFCSKVERAGMHF